MIKKIISTTFLLAIIASVNLTALAYSTDQYDIEIPDSFIQQSEPDIQDDTVTFVSSENENCVIYIRYQKNTLDFEFSETNLNFFKEAFAYGLDAQDESQYGNNNITGEITTFTKNNYKCFHYNTEYLINDDATDYSEMYITKSDNVCYIIGIVSDNKEFFELESTKNIINSFTIKNYTPETDKLDNIPFTTPENFNISNFNFNNFTNIYSALLSGIIAISMLFKVIAIIIALAIVKKNNRKDTSYAEESNSRQLENEQNPGGDQNLN